MKVVTLNGEHLTLEEVEEVAEGRVKVRVASSVVNKMRRSRNFIEKALRQERVGKMVGGLA